MHRTALREAAKSWALAEWQGTPVLPQRTTLAATAGSRKACKFMVDLSAVSPAANGSAAAALSSAEIQAQRAAMFGEGGPGGAPVAFSGGKRGAQVRRSSHLSVAGQSRHCISRGTMCAHSACFLLLSEASWSSGFIPTTHLQMRSLGHNRTERV